MDASPNLRDWGQTMNEYYQVAVSRDAGNLKFPGKCAYCLVPTPAHLIVKDKQLDGYELKVPYCEKHSKMIAT
jgi:hypothetical protein